MGLLTLLSQQRARRFIDFRIAVTDDGPSKMAVRVAHGETPSMRCMLLALEGEYKRYCALSICLQGSGAVLYREV